MLTALQQKLIYFPTRANETGLLQQAAAMGLAPWRDEAGRLIGWRTEDADAVGPRLVVFHGNAGHALQRAYYARGFQSADSTWRVYLFEYPGYGARDGEPGEDAIKQAATAAIRGLLAERDEAVWLVGESLGSGVAAWLAGEVPDRIGGILLVTPFTSLADVAAHHYPWLPVQALLRERFEVPGPLSRFRGPVAFLLAGRDEVVPVALGRAVHDGYAGPKWLRVEPDAGHNTLDMRPEAAWWREVSALLRPTKVP